MNISKKWRAAAAGVVALALVGGGASAANAATWTADGEPVNPQSNGSLGSFFLYNGDSAEYVDGDDARVYAKNESLLIAGNSTDVGSEIKAPAQAAGFTQVYRFVAKASEMSGGVNTWRAYDNTMATGPTGGVIYDNFTFQDKIYANNGGIDSVLAEGGEWYAGIAFTTNNGVTPLASIYRTINVDAAADTFTVKPVEFPGVAVSITDQPDNTSVTEGANATFTADAAPADAAVKWQSSTDGTTWSDVAGATSKTLTVSATTVAQNGTQYRAIFTKGAQSATTNAATLTVTPGQTAPVEPTGSTPNKVTIANPADGATTVTVPAGVANKDKALKAWGWSEPTALGDAVVNSTTGDATVNVSSLAPGSHKIALTEAGDGTFNVVAWGTVEIPVPTYPAKTDTVDIKANVTASDLWALNAEKTEVNFGDVARGESKTATLGKVTVTDDRKVLKGWNLTAAASAFSNGTDQIPASVLAIAPAAFAGYTLPTGITTGTNGASFASSEHLVSTGTTGALFDAGLTFTAPANANAGLYQSTLTLTLISK